MASLFDHHLVNDAFGDPALLVSFRDERRALLFDLGDVSALRPGVLLRLTHVFVTHTHMDHFCGFDHLLRIVLGRKAALVMVGGPGFAAQVEHKLRAYTWNVVHRYEVELVITVCETDADGIARWSRFSSRRGFGREDGDAVQRGGDVLHEEATFRVRGRFVDHGMPCLALALEEKARLRVATERLAELGVTTGAWLRELRHAVLNGAPDDTPIAVRWRDRGGEHAMTRPLAELRACVLDEVAGVRVGYVTDLRYTEPNVEALAALLPDVDVLYIESVFLHADAAHGERKNHLTARQAGEIARRLGAKAVVPFHHSPRYQGRAADLAAEARAAWMGRA
ncbi:MBL fold metallo-hydrolase [Piscinibacter sp. XHJ-5]|uniref:ribonuclease Z n=1 Tax=Piscinibacter sp. XHJ-5 TaxID=3037797 RepID=UPI002452F05B|nr:MBL fold metallo-hydrolase [Piscinibacter sp. XHJ-5]